MGRPLGCLAWTRKEEQALVQLFRDGAKTESVAMQLNRTVEAVSCRMRLLGFSGKYGRRFSAWAAADDAELIARRKAGEPVLKISMTLRRSEYSVAARLKHLGVTKQKVRQ